MLQFFWKWAAFTALNVGLVAVTFALFEGKMTGNAWGLVSLAFGLILLLAFIGEQVWLAASELNPATTTVIVVTTIVVLIATGIGYAWLIRPLTEMSWQLGLTALLILAVSAGEAFLAQIGRRD